MSVYKCILIATDGSALAKKAEAVGLQLAKTLNAEAIRSVRPSRLATDLGGAFTAPTAFSPKATWTEAAKRAGAAKNWRLGRRLRRDNSNLDGTGHDGTLAVVE
jgi:nucleotide-binding universal stress UspA family protein